VTYFAGIPHRIGYNRKLGALLSHKIPHQKQHGQKHESAYTLELLESIGIKVQEYATTIPLRLEAERWAEGFLKDSGVSSSDRLLALHPGASCPSKIWPQERFAQVADILAQRHGFKVVVVSGPKEITLAHSLLSQLKSPALDLAGKTSVSQLASILKRCQLLISNDSGPVHVASAVGTPVVSIFGRKQKGLGPRRWGPVGKRDRVLHKDVGCIECLAHNCVKEYACLKAISVDEVVKVAEEIL